MSLDASILARRGPFTLQAEFSLEPGTLAAVIGPNGSGKSTLAEALAGLLPIESGRITLNGRTLDDGRAPLPACARRVGFMFQDLLLFAHMSALDNAAFGPRCGGVSRAESRRRAMHWLDRLGVGDLADRKPGGLSGGQAQRVALARALAAEPELLILDEPLSALDVRTRPATRRLLAGVLADFPGVKLIITHDPIEAMALGERLLVFESGRLVQQGTPDEIRRSPRADYAASLVGVNLFRGTLEAGEGRVFVVLDGGGRLSIPDGGLRPGGEVFATVHPHSVILSIDKPASSARNTLPGVVSGIDSIDGRVRVHLDADPGRVRITAEITPNAAAELDIKPGSRLWASFKATDIGVYPR